MADPWDRAEEALVSLELRTQYDERNRLELLFVHAMKGMAVGVLMMLYGSPNAWVIEFGTDAEVFLWLPAFVGGLSLMIGLLWNRHILLEAFGMAMLLTWDMLMIYTLGKSGENPYAVAVYAGVAALMGIHLRTLWRYLKSRTEVEDHG